MFTISFVRRFRVAFVRDPAISISPPRELQKPVQRNDDVDDVGRPFARCHFNDLTAASPTVVQ